MSSRSIETPHHLTGPVMLRARRLRRLLAALRKPARKRAFHEALAERLRYEHQIDRLGQRRTVEGGLHRVRPGDVSPGSLVMHRGTIARLLARDVVAGQHELAPATLRQVRVNGKLRTVYSVPLLDQVVHGVVAGILSERLEPLLSSDLYSYRPGRSWADAASAFAAYVRAHRRERPDPRTRGLYVLRRDVDAYTDSIPVDDASALWSQLADLVGPADPTAWRLVRAITRPDVVAGGATVTRAVGVPTGLPISCVAFNLYLGDLDREMHSIQGAFYARYSDDLIFAHPDADVARAADLTLERHLAALRLRFSAAKRSDVYLTGAGRPSAEWPAARGTTSVELLGMRVSMNGTVALGERKVRILLREARRRAQNTARATSGQTLEARGRAVTSVIDRLLDADEAQLGGAAAPLLAFAVTDRAQLDWLDAELAQVVASAVSGVAGVAAFRRVPWRQIRGDWGLRSLRRARDRGATAWPQPRRPLGRATSATRARPGTQA